MGNEKQSTKPGTGEAVMEPMREPDTFHESWQCSAVQGQLCKRLETISQTNGSD